jgi:hypothetical protein
MLQQSISILYSAICCARLATFENIGIYHSYLHGAFDLMAYMINNHVFIPDCASQLWDVICTWNLLFCLSFFFMQLTCLFVSYFFDSACFLRSNDFSWLTMVCDGLSSSQVRRTQITLHCRIRWNNKLGFFFRRWTATMLQVNFS